MMQPGTITKDSKWSWIVSVGAFVAMMLETGMVKCLGVLLPELREQFSTDTWVIGLAISLAPGFGAVTCIMATALSKATSTRITVMLFGFISSIGLIFVSVSNSVPVLIVSLLLTSFSYGAEGIAFAALPDYFNKYFDISNSIGHVGIGVGVMILPLLTQFLRFLYGWRGSVLILGGLNAHIIVSGTLLRPTKQLEPNNVEYIAVEKCEKYDDCSTDSKPKILDKNESLIDRLNRIFGLHLFYNLDFMCVLLLNTSAGYYYTGWLIYLVPHAEDLGISPYAATAIATFGGIGNIVGSCIFPIVTTHIPNKSLIYISKLIVFLSLVVDPILSLTRSYPGLVMASFMMNVGEALDACSIFKEAYNVVDHTSFIAASNFMFFCFSVGSVCSGFWSGWLYDLLGNYTVSFLFLSALPLLSLTPMAIKDFIASTREHNYKRG